MSQLKVYQVEGNDAYSFVVEGHILPQIMCRVVQRHYELQIGEVAHLWGEITENEDGVSFSSSDTLVFSGDKPFTALRVYGDFRDESVETYIKVRREGPLEFLTLP